MDIQERLSRLMPFIFKIRHFHNFWSFFLLSTSITKIYEIIFLWLGYLFPSSFYFLFFTLPNYEADFFVRAYKGLSDVFRLSVFYNLQNFWYFPITGDTVSTVSLYSFHLTIITSSYQIFIDLGKFFAVVFVHRMCFFY